MKTNEYYELLGRINELESRLHNLELNHKNINKEEINMNNIEEIKIGKNEMISHVKEILEPILEPKGYFVRKAIPKNGEGSGILLESKGKLNNKKIMLKKSKDYAKQYNFDDEFKFSGWFTSSGPELSEYDGYIFIVYKDSVPTYFIFNKNEMKYVLEQKIEDSTGKYHFYLAEDKRGQYFDHREGGLLLTGNVNAWGMIEEIISEES
ncbi:hypothetical protein [Mammaliicoccus lentus]|uniref:hypothetical protein n=1 Tax=Mammaliicoccus lentus TaxID=42858 RepID=UPI001C4FF59F|nr:hypothetical protein [Mammaliicoccus lentus]MBW0768702.1 hypothetical protein [Mammaliicoccus lentus]